MPVRRPLERRRIGLLESRKARELSELVTRMGGLPICAPALREAPSDMDLTPLLADLVAGRYQVAVALTAAAVTALSEAADRRGVLPALCEALGHMTLVCRGPKPQLALRRLGLRPTIVTATPHTGVSLLDALSGAAWTGQSVLLLHYGERNPSMSAAIAQLGAIVTDACLYEWHLPEDVEPIRVVIRTALSHEMDALLFTSQVQCRHLFKVAADMGVADRLLEVLQRDIAIGVIGPTCAGALREAGIVPDVEPCMPNSPSLVRALADYFILVHDSSPKEAARGDGFRVAEDELERFEKSEAIA